MEMFANRHGELLQVLRCEDVLDYLAEMTRNGQTEWQVRQSLAEAKIPGLRVGLVFLAMSVTS